MPIQLKVNRPSDFVEFHKDSIFQGIHQRFERQAHLYPTNVALKTKSIAYTYAKTNGHANSIAHNVLSLAGKDLAQAAILLSNTPEMIIAILAALKARKAYVPLDVNFPRERLQVMLEDVKPSVLLTDDEHIGFAESLAGSQTKIINISQIKRHADSPNPEIICDPLDIAYVLFTSGSTGRPKGITFLHRNLLHTTMCLTNQLFFAPSDRVTWLHSASFAASVVDIYCCLTNGATLYPWDVKTEGFTGMAEWLAQEKVSSFQWIPSAFRQFLRTVNDGFIFRDIRVVVMASEPLTVREVELFRRYFPAQSHLVNQVGTSESYNYRLYAVDHEMEIESANVPGGYPVSEDREVVILDDQRQELPMGATGEIGVRSDYMSAGYWNDDTLTQSKFVRLKTNKTPVYLTGDLGKLESDGCLIHFGRKDTQVKIRGYRVELAEVDHALNDAPGVSDAAAAVMKSRINEDLLVGFVVPKKVGDFNQQEVEKHLSSKLPDYMTPKHYVILSSLPTLPTGKINRAALPNPFTQSDELAASSSMVVENHAQKLVGLFNELLLTDDVNLLTDFIKAGGDSLLAAVLLHRIHQSFNIEIRINDFYQSPTPAHTADLVRVALIDQARPNVLTTSKTRFAPTPAEAWGETLAAVPTTGAIQNLVIISAGKFGRETFTWATQAIKAGAALKIKGFLDNRINALTGYNYPTSVLGDVETYIPEENDVFVGAIGDPRDKIKYYSPIIKRGGRFTNIIHPLANIGMNVQLGAGIVLAPFSSITSDVKIGNHVSVGAFSNLGHDTAIGDWCQISSHCGINGNATLGEGVFLGSHSCVIPQIKVGEWSFVGAGSVVVRNVEAGSKVFGNPAAPIVRSVRARN